MNWLTSYVGYMAAAIFAILPIVNPLGAVPLVMTVYVAPDGGGATAAGPPRLPSTPSC